MPVVIDEIISGSLAEKKKIAAGDILLSINGHSIEDVLDYRFYMQNEKVVLKIQTPKKERTVRIRKAEDEELGLEFSSYLMDEQRHCRNNCIFCFIDQLPKGLRDTLYFKDDDSRLSFLFGNYITLTNLSEHEISRIIEMHISPVNVSVHTTNPELRCKMMNNRFAGDSLKILRRFSDAGLAINAQLVLCPGYNDGDQLSKTMEDLISYLPSVQSVAAVPVGLTRYREGLPPLRLFTKEESEDVIRRMEAVGDRMLSQYGKRIFYPSDEFFIKAERPIPDASYYGDFLQLENGVGMMALFCQQFEEALDMCEDVPSGRSLTAVTGQLAYPMMQKCVEKAKQKYPSLQVQLVPIRNDFFGETITVTGLVVGEDIVNQLKGQCGEVLLVPASMLRSERDLFLDSMSTEEVAEALQTEVCITDCDGFSFVEALMQ